MPVSCRCRVSLHQCVLVTGAGTGDEGHLAGVCAWVAEDWLQLAFVKKAVHIKETTSFL